MPQAKYRLFYQLMWQQNQSILENFRQLQQQAADDLLKQPSFHQIGREVLDIVRDWDRRLCSGMERGQYANYSQKLSEKFWQLVKKDFPLIDQVGVKIKYR